MCRIQPCFIQKNWEMCDVFKIPIWRRLCLQLQTLEVRNVLCDMCSSPEPHAFTSSSDASLVLVSCVRPWWSSQLLCRVAALFVPGRGVSTSTCHTLPLISTRDSLRKARRPPLSLPPLPLWSEGLRAFLQRLVTGSLPSRRESVGPAPCLPPDGWPVWLYLSRTTTVLAGSQRLSPPTALSGPDL